MLYSAYLIDARFNAMEMNDVSLNFVMYHALKKYIEQNVYFDCDVIAIY
jgi:hypothetical protein